MNIRRLINKEYFYNINQSYLGPFNDTYNEDEIRLFLADVDHMYITYEFHSIIPLPFSHMRCLVWVN